MKKYSKGAYNSRLGLAIMRQLPQENAQMIVAIMLPKEDAESLADQIIDILDDDPEVEA